MFLSDKMRATISMHAVLHLCFTIVLWCCSSSLSGVLFVSSFVPLWNHKHNNYYDKRMDVMPSTVGGVAVSMVNFLDLNNNRNGGNDASFTETKLVELAKSIFATDLGIANPSLLSSDFVFLSSALDAPLGKTDYVAAGRFFDLRAAFSDLDYRPHDFRIVPGSDPRTSCVRCTMRVTGTMRGNLRLRDGVLPPTGRTMVCPPEAVTMVFENVADDPKLVKLCTFVMDNGVGNTEGTTGVMAASIIAGKRVSPWEISPPWTVITRFVGRPIPPAEKKNVFLAPFPESVMISLAKGVIASEMGYNDPTLLSGDFIYSTPIVNVRKAPFLEQFARVEFAGVTPNFSNFRIDPYYPVRVWVDLQPTAEGYIGHPQAMSFTFDEDGYCTRVTSSYVMDISVGNGGGLGGPEGYKYATKENPSPFFVTRPWPKVLGRVQKFITSPVTGVGVDDYRLPGTSVAGQEEEQFSEESDEASKPPAAFSIPSLSVKSPPPPPPLPRKPQGETKPSMQGISIPSFNLSPSLAKPTPESAQPKPNASLSISIPFPSLGSKPPSSTTSKPAKPSPSISIPSLSLGPKSPIAKPPPKQTKSTPSITIPSFSLGPKPPTTKPPPKKTNKATAKSTSTPSARIPSLSLGPKPPATKPPPKVQVKKTPSITIPSLSLGPKPSATKPPPKTEAESRLEQLKDFAGSIRIVPPAPELSKADQAKAKAAEEEKKREAAAAVKKREMEMIKRQEEAKKRELEIKKKQAAAEQAIAKAAELRKRQAGEKRAEAAKLAEQQKRQKAVDEQRATAAAAKAAAEEARKQKRQAEEEQKAAAAAANKAETARKQQEASTQKPLVNLAAGFSKTISLFGMGKAELEELPAASSSSSKSTPSAAVPASPRSVKTAPMGVPKLTRWRQNSDGTITGLVSGSRGFEEGQRITTSPIASGTIAAGEVVKTGSGSRYFLE
jgi:hypothetical protein